MTDEGMAAQPLKHIGDPELTLADIRWFRADTRKRFGRAPTAMRVQSEQNLRRRMREEFPFADTPEPVMDLCILGMRVEYDASLTEAEVVMVL